MSLFSLLLRMLLALALVAGGPGAGAGVGVGVAADVQVGDAVPVALHGMAGSHSSSTSTAHLESKLPGDCHRAAEAAAAVTGTSVDQGLAVDRYAGAAEAGGNADLTDCCEPGCDPGACGGCLHHCAADIAGPGLAGHHAVPQAGPVFFSTRHTSPVLSGVFRPPIG